MIAVTARAYWAVRPWLPSNRLIDLVRTRRGHKWGLAVMALAIPSWFLASACLTLAGRGGPAWWNVVAAVLVWSGLKYAFAGPASLVWLARARLRERWNRPFSNMPALSGVRGLTGLEDPAESASSFDDEMA
ncbi:MAG: sulfate permease [Bifidobacteriaceae bacterium]|nr:sulfate permease [Bifidobacteriaceae bacterium]